ncbi:unnamed protein product [Rhodiola kirilowii]
MAARHRNVSIYVTLSVLLILTGSSLASSYSRPPRRSTLHVAKRDKSASSPDQVHISVVGADKIRVTWISDDKSAAVVKYGTSKDALNSTATGSSSTYKYILYTSGNIYDVVIGPIQPNSVYYYTCGSDDTQVFSFKSSPAQFPVQFAVVGDLGQTEWTKSTLKHLSESSYDVLLLPGDLSYANTIQSRWDSFGRLVEPLASQRPWMVTHGNHEPEKIPILHSHSFTSYNARWHMPFEESGSDSNLYYSFDVAGVHVIMLGSYTDFDPNSAQYKWLEADLRNVDRRKVKWVLVNVHAPWYSTNTAHQGEDESVKMRESMEDLIFEGRVDVVFAGHVHAYERFNRVYKDKGNDCGPVHIVIGDGGNEEGLASKYMDPKPDISLFREASFGHGQLEVVNETHALWTWHRNDDDEPVIADSTWLKSLSSNPACNKS